MHALVTRKYKKDWMKIKNTRKSGDTVFAIITPRELSAAMDNRVLNRSVSKPDAAFPPPQ